MSKELKLCMRIYRLPCNKDDIYLQWSSSRGSHLFCNLAFTLGVLVVTVLKILTRTRNSVTSRAIRPGITSIGIRKDIQDTITNSPKYPGYNHKYIPKYPGYNHK